VILECGRVAERWQSERWDSPAFQFPSWGIRLPGCAYRGGDPDGFAPRDEVVRFIERCAKQEPGPRRAMSEKRLYVTYAPGRHGCSKDQRHLEDEQPLRKTHPSMARHQRKAPLPVRYGKRGLPSKQDRFL
jgi:hypothetical protein